MNVTIDLATVLVAGLAIVAGVAVYQWMAPVGGATAPRTKGERLAAALGTAAAAIAIGSYIVSGVKSHVPQNATPGNATTSVNQQQNLMGPSASPTAVLPSASPTAVLPSAGRATGISNH
ncbi:hypothetical protein [Streptomyces sp. NPDC002078]